MSEAITTTRHPHHDHKLHVTVHAPRHPRPKHFDFPPQEIVAAAAAQAASAFGYRPGQHSFQNESGEVLDRNISLRDAGVRDRDVLELVEAGGGV